MVLKPKPATETTPQVVVETMNEVFRRAGDRIGDLSKADNADRWIMSVTNEVLDEHIKFVRHIHFRRAIAEAAEDGAQRQVLADASDRDFRDALDTLDDGQRRLLLLLFMEEASVEDAAAATRRPANTIRAAMRQILHRLAVNLGAIKDGSAVLPIRGEALADWLATGGVDLDVPEGKLVSEIAALRVARDGYRTALCAMTEQVPLEQRVIFLRWFSGESVSAIAEAEEGRRDVIEHKLHTVISALAQGILGVVEEAHQEEEGARRAEEQERWTSAVVLAAVGGQAFAEMLAAGGVDVAVPEESVPADIAVLQRARVEHLDALCVFVEQLPSRHQEAFVRWFAGQPLAGIAEACGLARSAVDIAVCEAISTVVEQLPEAVERKRRAALVAAAIEGGQALADVLAVGGYEGLALEKGEAEAVDRRVAGGVR